MKIKSRTAYNAIAYIALICQALTWIGLPFRQYGLVSISVALISIASIFGFFVLILDNQGAVEKSNDLISLLVVLAVVVTVLILTQQISSSVLIKMLTFFQLPVFLLVARSAKGDRIRDVVYAVNACYPILFLYYYNAPFSHRYEGLYGEVAHDSITLGFANPNETAIYLMVCAFIVLAALFHYRTLLKRAIFAIEFAWLLFLLAETDCRSALILTLAVLAFSVLFRKVTLGKGFLQGVFIIPVLAAFLVLIFPQLGELEIMGEKLDTGRSILTYVYLEELTFSDFLLGNFTRYPLTNMHNAFMSVLAAFGIVSVFVYWGFMYRGYVRLCVRPIDSMEKKVLLLSCLAMIVHSSVESALLISGSIYATSSFLLLFMLGSVEGKTDKG